MTNKPDIAVTADGLVVLRADPRHSSVLKDQDPHAKWFVTDAGKQFMQMATSMDPIYVQFNMARYDYMTQQMKQAVHEVDQVVIVGSGYDTRPLWLEEFQKRQIPVYEIDQPHVIESKKAVLAKHEVKIPHWLHLVSANLSQSNLLDELTSHGYQKNKKTYVHIEGVIFFLPEELVSRILDTAWIRLGKGSVVLFDCWINQRINFKNQQFKKKTGKKLFGKWPFSDDSKGFMGDLFRLGYSAVDIVWLDSLAKQMYEDDLSIETPKAWPIIKAQI